MQLTKEVEWQVLKTPRYQVLSNQFRRAIENVQEKATQKNLDGGYVELTLSCVKCHKYVREVRDDPARWKITAFGLRIEIRTLAMANSSPPPIRLLIVDDDDQLRQTLARRFQHQGMEVTTAADAEDALAKAEHTRCDVALLDLQLPGKSGIELLARLKERQPELEALLFYHAMPGMVPRRLYRGLKLAIEYQQAGDGERACRVA
jgi:CheY-like chemotaxis protein